MGATAELVIANGLVLKFDQTTTTKLTLTKQSNSSTLNNNIQHSINNWTLNDIRQWFHDHNVHNDLILLIIEQFQTITSLIIS